MIWIQVREPNLKKDIFGCLFFIFSDVRGRVLITMGVHHIPSTRVSSVSAANSRTNLAAVYLSDS